MLKLMPYEPYEIDALESWLDEQARKGCFLSQSHGKWLQFYRDAPRPLRCRIDVKPDPGYHEDRVAAFHDMGAVITPACTICCWAATSFSCPPCFWRWSAG